ncbi:MAG: S8 family serine peptidase [Phaeodactylibacter sp.]|nr:S8 family serine peptidase [Phaeodactylibacter sp.]MCB9275470.1 S8 family serine peptidase [Lewinellaceae bacterium]
MKVWKKLILGMGLMPGLFFTLSAQTLEPSTLTSSLLEQLESRPEGYHSIYVALSVHLDVRALEQQLKARGASLQERAYAIITGLQEKAGATQPPLLEELEKMEGVRPSSIEPLWIVNAIFMEADYAAIARLSHHPAIEYIGYNQPLQAFDQGQSTNAAPILNDNTEPGPEAIGAPQLWAQGYTGYGRKVLIIDTGQDIGHPALFNQFAYHNHPFDESWASPDAVGYCDSHGTNVASCAVGMDRINRDTLGVAFDGEWMGGPIFLNLTSGGTCQYDGTVLSSFQTMQWALNPDGNAATTDDMPDVINNSWGGTASAADCFDGVERNLYDALMGAGIAVVYAAGNEGPGASTISRPGVLNYDLVRIFTVGNVNANNPSFPINVSSSRGPSICSGSGSLSIKPEVSAPGTQVRMATVGGGYTVADGTSFSAPHTSGAILLLKQAFPYLSGEDIMLALYFSCTDLGQAGEDNIYGMGIINLPAAFQYLVDQGHEPVAPIEATNDVVLLSVEVSEFNCAEAITPLVLLENDGTDTLTSITFRLSLEDNAAPALEHTWEGLLLPKERLELLLPPLSAPAGDRVLVVEAIEANGQPDARSLNNRLKKEVKVIEEDKVPAEVIGGAPVCQNSQALLRSLYDAPARVRWYDAEEGGALLGEGNPLLMQVGGNPQTVYARVSPLAQVGKSEYTGNVQMGNTEQGLIFNAETSFYLRSVKVYAEEAGGRLIRLVRADGSTVNKIVQLQAGEQRVTLDLLIQPGDGQKLVLGVGNPLRFTVGVTSFPYTVPKVMSITRSTNSTIFYYYFFDWEIEYDYFCGRTPLEIGVAAANNAPQVAFTPQDTLIDLALGSNEVAFSDQSTGAISWLWDFGDGTASSLQNPAHAYGDTGVYQVTLTAVGPEGCSSSSIGSVQVTEGTINHTVSVAEPKGFSLFPNPASQRVFLVFNSPLHSEAAIAVMDVLGRPVLNRRIGPAEGSTVEISVQGLPPGAYWVAVQADGRRLVEKLLIGR